MDFPGCAATNIHLIDGFSTIYWRIYTEESGIANHSPEAPTSGYTILKRLGHLKYLETCLRNHKCLASCPRRLGLWVFSSTPDFESLDSLYVKEGEPPLTKIRVDVTTLKVSASGSITSQDLIRSLCSESESKNSVQSNSSQRPQQVQPSARRSDGHSSSAAIYASFISAVTGAIGLDLVQRYGALPLGSRTLFTAVETSGSFSPRIDNESVLSTSYLTSLNVQLHASGTITIAPSTTSQDGITRLCSPGNDIADLLQVPPGTDLWLCPNGAIARLVTANIESAAAPSPGQPKFGNVVTKREQWKLDVLQWLANWGLHIDSIHGEHWVEVEVWEPFFARLAGDSWRQSDDTQSGLSLKRILWPSRFCFKRCGASRQSSSLPKSFGDPLEFAERWFSESSSLRLSENLDTPAQQGSLVKDHDMTSPKVDTVETFESLSRMAQYPDLQATTNLVYPTPPDGAAVGTVNHTNPSDVFPEDTDFKLSPSAAQNMKHLIDTEFSPDVAVGTGRYDASDDEDLFGEMNERDFGAKGITDADFSFFDDPALEHMDDDATGDQIQPTPNDQPEHGSPRKDGCDEADPTETPAQTTDAVEDPKDEALPAQNKPESEDMQIDHGAAQSSPGPRRPPISPPLSPVGVKKILFAHSLAENDSSRSKFRVQQGHYHPIAFEKRIGDWDQKYGTTGKFWFSPDSKHQVSGEISDTIPKIGLPRRGRNSTGQTQADQCTSSQLMGSGTRSSSAASGSSNEDSEELPLKSAPLPVGLPNLKRKRAPSDVESITSPVRSPSWPESALALKSENSAFLGNFLASFSDWTLTGYFSAPQIQQLPVLLRPEDQAPVAQLLVDQVTQSSLNPASGARMGLFGFECEVQSLRTLFDETGFPGMLSKLDLKEYASLQNETDVPSSQETAKDPARSPIARVPAPHLRVRRGKNYLETLPPALSFWEIFGLEPAHGAKDVLAYCIHTKAAAKAADAFIDRFGLAYQSCNFGVHTRGNKDKAMRTWNAEPFTYSSMMHSLKGLCEELASDLSKSPPRTDNVVIYIINPFKHAAALADICAAFWHLFQQLIADGQQNKQINDIALQIIPMEFIFSGEYMVVPKQIDYLNLAFEVYGRCRPKDPESMPVLSAPAVLLADPLPKSINFRLAPEKLSPLQDGRSLNIACSKSSDQRWVSVAWSDGTGSIQTTMSYCLRYRNKNATRTIAEVRNEVWATTKNIIEQFQARWRVILANTEPMDADDVEGWINLADLQNKMRPASVELTIVIVNSLPDLVLESPIPPMTTAVLNPHFSSSPVSTPNPSASIASPEQSGNTPTSSAIYSAPTPSEPALEPDADVVLTDISDESWTVVLSHRLNSSAHIADYRPALASGYLLRRKGSSDGNDVHSMTVNLVYSQRPSSHHDSALKDILTMYRDLATLARARGMRSVQHNTLPWHIATALRAQELLSYVF